VCSSDLTSQSTWWYEGVAINASAQLVVLVVTVVGLIL